MNKSSETGQGYIVKEKKAREIIPVSHHVLEKIAAECGAKYRYGKSVFYDTRKILEYLEKQTA